MGTTNQPLLDAAIRAEFKMHGLNDSLLERIMEQTVKLYNGGRHRTVADKFEAELIARRLIVELLDEAAREGVAPADMDYV